MDEDTTGNGFFEQLTQRFGPRLQRVYANVREFGTVVFGRDVQWRKRLAYITAGLATFFGISILLLALYSILLIPFTPGISDIRKAKAERPTVVYSADGVKLTEFKPLNREWVRLDEIAPEVRMALIATEDHRFYDHRGIDLRRIFGAALRTMSGSRQGASTITQQLARNLYPQQIGRRPTIRRKLKEMVTTFKIEAALSKEEILETYLNTVPFLYDAYGIELAAKTYFGVSAADLTIEQAATLVGMLKGTYFYNPLRHPERARARRNVVLQQMVRRGFLREDRYDLVAASDMRLRFQRQPRMRSESPHFTEYVRRSLTRWAERRGYNIYRDSLVVHTTLDTRLQQAAQQSVDQWAPLLQAIAEAEWSRPDVRVISRSPTAYARYRRSEASFSYLWEGQPELVRAFIRATPQFRAGVSGGVAEDMMIDSLRADGTFMSALRQLKSRLEVGFVAMNPQTGGVLAWVGSRSFEDVPYDHVAVARRQPGSIFKPFVYATALERGYRPDDTLRDEEVQIVLRNGHVWSPRNAGGTFSGRDMTLSEGLAQSKNTITAQLIDQIGIGPVARTAERMGVSRSHLDEVPSMALGTSDASLLEMVAAYATLANGGIYRQPVVIERIENSRGRTVYQSRSRARRALKEENALRMVEMMRGVIDNGTGRRVRSTFGIREDLAGKTGTTQGNADGWFIAMHPELVAGAWAGFGDPRVTFRTDYWGAGGNNALLIVGEFYRRAFRHPETRLVGIRFPAAPEYVERETLWQHVRGFFSDAGDLLGDALAGAAEWIRGLFGETVEELEPDAQPAPPRRDAPVPSPEDDDLILASADSLAQAERDSVMLQQLLERLAAERDTVELPIQDTEPIPIPLPSEREELPRQGPPGGTPPGQQDRDGPPGQSPPGQRDEPPTDDGDDTGPASR
jgi:penicillin-binding protein 1A